MTRKNLERMEHETKLRDMMLSLIQPIKAKQAEQKEF
jgi:hypothetical protein